MKKNICLLLLAVLCCHQLNAGPFDGFGDLTKMIERRVARLFLAQKNEPYKTPAGMVPLSSYHCVGLKYTQNDPVKDLEQQLAKGIRYFEFDIRSEEKTIKSWRTLWQEKKEKVPVVGSNARPLIDIITDLATILQGSKLKGQDEYIQEVVIVKLNNATIANLSTMAIAPKLEKLLFTPKDTDLGPQPTLMSLRMHNKRLALLLDNSNYETYTKGFLLKSVYYKQLFNVDNNYALVQNLSTDIATVNRWNAAEVGSPYFPKISRSFFSPHFNMYHYVGMDYTDKTTDELQRELAYGVRGFIFPLTKTKDGQILIGNTDTPLQLALRTICTFAKEYNEIVVVHLKAAGAISQFPINTIADDPIIKRVLFKPEDRLTQANGSAAKDKIKKFEENAKEIKIWPRLTWNYENEKLVQITWDIPASSPKIWFYNKFYSGDTTQNSLSNVKVHGLESDNFETIAPMKEKKSALFYSDTLRTEQSIASGLTFGTALSIGIYLAMQKITDIAFWSLPSYENIVFKNAQEFRTREQIEAGYALLKIMVGMLIAQPLSMINQGIYAANNIFTIVREEQIPINYMINGYFTTQPISTFVAAKLEGKKTIFDKVNYLNRYNYILIDKQAISWTLTLSHLARKALAPKIE